MIAKETVASIKFGYGPAGKGAGAPDAMLAALKNGNDITARYPMHTQFDVFQLYAQIVRNRKNSNSMSMATSGSNPTNALKLMNAQGLAHSVARILDTSTPFFERLTWFWADHFTVVSRRGPTAPLATAYIEEAIRPHVTGRFADMLKAVVTHPAMLDYLDQNASIGPNSPYGLRSKRGLNENLAREVLELHTLGVGADYTQADVRQLAELFTGLTYDLERGYFFNGEIVEPGREQLLGKVYGNGMAGVGFVMEALEDLAAHPTTARHLATKIARHFVSDTPDQDLISTLEDAYRTSEGNLMSVYSALLDHPSTWKSLGNKVRQPFDFLATAMIAMNIRGEEIANLSYKRNVQDLWVQLRNMGQTFLEPGGPNGWPEDAEHWITPQGLSNRINFAIRLTARHGSKVDDPQLFLERVLADASREDLKFATRAAETKSDAVALILASAELNRR